MVCGPTASGKSEASDALADKLSDECAAFVPTVAVDSMQVYREIPAITNQARRRPAELVGIVPVTEAWTVARHKARAEKIIAKSTTPFVLDAGTGLYLNAIVLDVPLAPKVESSTRRIAESLTAAEPNRRRAARAKELELAGVRDRGSIWDGEPRYDTVVVYLRPDQESLAAAIDERSERIARDGLEEAAEIMRILASGARVSSSVSDSIGVRELLEHLGGEITAEEARSRINTRTRQLARRQVRWFDKLARTLGDRVPTTVIARAQDLNTMHDIIRV